VIARFGQVRLDRSTQVTLFGSLVDKAPAAIKIWGRHDYNKLKLSTVHILLYTYLDFIV
jgi:hypothetical protein